jgi:ubiquinone/menaquinone biosynthesis C-methylase UbiE
MNQTNNETDPSGDAGAFEDNWKKRPETEYLHWTRGDPANQIQLAFRRHWLTFQNLIDGREGKQRCLEVGCGRGSLSAYFADAGWECTLLDLAPKAIERAQIVFGEHGLNASFDIGDCLSLPYEESSFDLVFSIGLLEHFEKIDQVLSEQFRVLAPGGLFIGYVVPHFSDNVQGSYEWVNDLLRALLAEQTGEASFAKTEIYRSDAMSPRYLEVMRLLGFVEMGQEGAYPLPMISHSPDFPFSLLPKEAEANLVETFQKWLDERESRTGKDPWLCHEGEGQAFLVWGRKAK